MLRGIKIVPVITGVALDWYLTYLFSFFIGIYIASSYFSGHGHSPSHFQALEEARSTFNVIAAQFIGAASSVVGGFIAGWMAKGERIKNGLAMGIVSAITSGMLVHFTEHPGIWHEIVGNSVTVLAGTLGGYLAKLAYDRPPAPFRPQAR